MEGGYSVSARCLLPECPAPAPDDRPACGVHFPRIRVFTLNHLLWPKTVTEFDAAVAQAIAEMRGTG